MIEPKEHCFEAFKSIDDWNPFVLIKDFIVTIIFVVDFFNLAYWNGINLLGVIIEEEVQSYANAHLRLKD